MKKKLTHLITFDLKRHKIIIVSMILHFSRKSVDIDGDTAVINHGGTSRGLANYTAISNFISVHERTYVLIFSNEIKIQHYMKPITFGIN
jgi:hypothetical protein